jgi:phospholipase/carboxylesterase
MDLIPLRTQKQLTDKIGSLDNSTFAKASSGVIDFPYLTFGPLHYEPNYAYPLIVWLHGPRDDHKQMVRIMPLISMRNFLGVAPQGVPIESESTTPKFGWPDDEMSIDTAVERVTASIEAAGEKFHFSTKRIFLAGFDTGGTMAFRVAASHPEKFAGVISLGGRFPHSCTPLGSLNAFRKLPIFIGAGRDSSIYPANKVSHDLRLLHTAGFSMTIRQYPCGQELSPQMLSDLDRWIIEQITA